MVSEKKIENFSKVFVYNIPDFPPNAMLFSGNSTNYGSDNIP